MWCQHVGFCPLVTSTYTRARSSMLLTLDTFCLLSFGHSTYTSTYTHTVRKSPWACILPHSHWVALFGFMLQPFWLPFFFLLHLRLEMSLLVSVPTPSSAFTHRTHNHIHNQFPSHARAFILCFFFGLNCRKFTISPVNSPLSFLWLRCS